MRQVCTPIRSAGSASAAPGTARLQSSDATVRHRRLHDKRRPVPRSARFQELPPPAWSAGSASAAPGSARLHYCAALLRQQTDSSATSNVCRQQRQVGTALRNNLLLRDFQSLAPASRCLPQSRRQLIASLILASQLQRLNGIASGSDAPRSSAHAGRHRAAK